LTIRQIEDICAAAIEQNGTQLQAVVALEELSEAQKEICKFLRGNGDKEHLAEELADAQIMLMQMEMAFGLTGSVRSWMDAKAQRLAERLKGGKK
jgi:hypothetical protein